MAYIWPCRSSRLLRVLLNIGCAAAAATADPRVSAATGRVVVSSETWVVCREQLGYLYSLEVGWYELRRIIKRIDQAMCQEQRASIAIANGVQCSI
jgi:hypothetical protein